MIEPGVIRFRERDDKLSGALVASVHVNACILQPLWVHERDELEEQVGLGLKQIRGFLLDGRFELLGVRTGNTIPRLGLAPVH